MYLKPLTVKPFNLASGKPYIFVKVCILYLDKKL
jgi:hypothetical protein